MCPLGCLRPERLLDRGGSRPGTGALHDASASCGAGDFPAAHAHPSKRDGRIWLTARYEPPATACSAWMTAERISFSAPIFGSDPMVSISARATTPRRGERGVVRCQRQNGTGPGCTSRATDAAFPCPCASGIRCRNAVTGASSPLGRDRLTWRLMRSARACSRWWKSPPEARLAVNMTAPADGPDRLRDPDQERAPALRDFFCLDRSPILFDNGERVVESSSRRE